MQREGCKRRSRGLQECLSHAGKKRDDMWGSDRG